MSVNINKTKRLISIRRTETGGQDRKHRRRWVRWPFPRSSPGWTTSVKQGNSGGTVEDAALAATREGHDFRRALRGGKDLGFSPRCP